MNSIQYLLNYYVIQNILENILNLSSIKFFIGYQLHPRYPFYICDPFSLNDSSREPIKGIARI